MKVSYSRIDLFKQCPYRFKLRYVDNLETKFDYKPDNPLVLGTAMHLGIDKGIDEAITNYYSNYPVVTEKMINEAIKLEILIPKVQSILPPGGTFEVEINNDDFVGFMDYLVEVPNEPTKRGYVPKNIKTYDLYDFKYSNNKNRYLESSQLDIYKYFGEKHLKGKIRNLYFVIIPKVNLEVKSNESIAAYRERLIQEVDKAEISLLPINYDCNKVIDFLVNVKHCIEEKEFNKNKNPLCYFCDYKKYCESDGKDMSEIKIK